MAKPLLGVCIIVRDATQSIDALLASIVGKTAGGTGEPAFDEYVFVDTGSVDDTRSRIARAFDMMPSVDGSATWGKNPHVFTFRGVRVVFAHFDWIDDFSAARNYSFSLSEAKWRGYLDADDVFPHAERLKLTLMRTEMVSPQTNCITLPYDYNDGEIIQDKWRFVRWADGWTWQDEIHESLRREPPAPRMVSKYDDLPVIHCHTDEHSLKSLKRNITICDAVRARALDTGDTQKAALMCYYLGLYAGMLGDLPLATKALLEAAAGLPPNNLQCDARVALAKLQLENGDVAEAINTAALATVHTPEEQSGHAVLGIAYEKLGDHFAAARAFDAFYATPRGAVTSVYDTVLLDGITPTKAASAYLALGRYADAERIMYAISPKLQLHPAVRPDLVEMIATLQKARAHRAVRELWEVLVQNDEPEKARFVLDLAPVFVADSVCVNDLRRLSAHRMRHLDEGWQKYVECYGQLDKDTYSPDRPDIEHVRAFSRARFTRGWAEALPKDGPLLQVLSIGPQDCIIERDILAACDRIHMTVADASPLAAGAVQDLANRFPGRVTHHAMTRHYDWPEGRFDAIVFFEVLEHVPDDVAALFALRRRLAPGGELFLSTPVASYWPNHTTSRPDGETRYDWWGHVRANSPTTLWQKLRLSGFDGHLDATENGTCFFAHVRCVAMTTQERAVSIYVPETPTPFDPDSHLRGHLGGSEECVVYLSAELARRGFDVTVYAPRPRREDLTVHARDGVLWRAPDEFDPGDQEPKHPVLFWRCPEVLLNARVKRSQCTKLLWLHDANYGASPEAYAAAAGVIVLSKFHAKIIEERDGYKGPFLFGANGIDLNLFPPLNPDEDAKRDPFKVVYGSSPDRGLSRLLDAWPRIRAAEPRATLDIYYSWSLLDAAMKKCPQLKEQHGDLKARAEGLAHLGVTLKGGVDQATLAKAYRTAGVWAYPSSFEEVFCITAVKAVAAGCIPVATATGSLPEVLNGAVWPLPEDFDGAESIKWFADRVIEAMKRPLSYQCRNWLSGRARRSYGWPAVAALFSTLIAEAKNANCIVPALQP